MKETMVNALTPAFEGFYKVVQFLATGIEYLSDEVAIGIQYITLFAEDTASAIKDIMSLNFGQIGADWANNYASIFNASAATKTLVTQWTRQLRRLMLKMQHRKPWVKRSTLTP